MRGEKQKKQRSLSSVNSIFSLKKIQRKKKKRNKSKGGVVKLKAFIHNLLRENSFRKKNSLPVHGQFVHVIEIILTMKSAFLLFRINILKRKVFRKKFDIVQSLDFLGKTKINVFKEKRRQSFFLLLFSSVLSNISDVGEFTWSNFEL